MTSTKYIGMDVHKESISIAFRNSAGKIVMECVIETKASIDRDYTRVSGYSSPSWLRKPIIIAHPSTMTFSGRLSTREHRIKSSSSCADRCLSAQT